MAKPHQLTPLDVEQLDSELLAQFLRESPDILQRKLFSNAFIHHLIIFGHFMAINEHGSTRKFYSFAFMISSAMRL